MPDQRKFCSAVRENHGWLCETAEHPGETHYTWINGWLTSWSGPVKGWENHALPGGPDAMFGEVPIKVDPALPHGALAFKRTEGETTFFLPPIDFFTPSTNQEEPAVTDDEVPAVGVNPDYVPGPLVEAVSLMTGAIIYGEHLPWSTAEQPRVRQCTGIIVEVVPSSIVAVEEVGHRGGCPGNCSREGMQGRGWIPGCWPPELVQSVGAVAASWIGNWSLG